MALLNATKMGIFTIGLLEPVWKLISAIVHRRLMDSITFHDDLHGFLPG